MRSDRAGGGRRQRCGQSFSPNEWQLNTAVTPEMRALAKTVDPSLKRVLRRLLPVTTRNLIRAWLLDAPFVSEIVRRLDPKLRRLGTVDRDTDVVIEGFPRSANSYARVAFLLANPDATVCSHTHSYRTVTRAVALGIPAIVLIREPTRVIASTLQYDPDVPPMRTIKQYRSFYQHVARLPADRIMLADFDDVIRDFGSVIASCNAMLGSSFTPYERSPESESRISEVLSVWGELAIPDELREVRSSLPRAARTDAAAEALDSLGPGERDALAAATAEYRSLRRAFDSATHNAAVA